MTETVILISHHQRLIQRTGINVQAWTVDENYIPTLGMKIVAGKKFFTTISY